MGDSPIPDDAWPRRTARLLLLLLLGTPGHQLPRDRVLEYLWPESSPESALNSLYVAVHGLRRVLEPSLRAGRSSSYMAVAGDVVGLRPEAVAWVDVEAFEAALAAAVGDQRRDRLMEALALYSGDFLADELFLDWPVARREHLRAAWRDAVLDYAEVEREAGHPLLAVPAVERVLQSDPTDEPAYRALMTLLATAGRREDALRQYERCVAMLDEEMGVEPSEETKALADEIRSAPSAPAPPIVPSAAVDNLPAPPNPLVGRGREVETIVDLLCNRNARLVTITGPGGVGKTRLSLETASLAANEFADGVCFVSLATVQDTNLVLPTIARTLGLEEGSHETPLAQLRGALRGRNLLLVLDNFEQILDASAAIADLLAECPRLSILVTSRERLRLRAEHEFPLAPLPIPDPELALTAGNVGRYPSARLFVARAEAVNPRFVLTDENAPLLGALCGQLDGLPLAIELAAARLRHDSLDALLAGLTDRLNLLTGGFRDLPPRQRTMREAIAWSYDLLSPDEQVLFRRLSVFVGGFTAKAAAHVQALIEGRPVPKAVPARITGTLEALVEKSLLRVQPDPDGQRYGMLETIREFGLEALDEEGERERAEWAHASWCVTLAEAAEPELTKADQKQWLDRIEVEHPNLRAAIERSLQDEQGEIALRISSALWRFWLSRGYNREGRAWAARALESQLGAQPRVRARALYALGELQEANADYAAAQQSYKEALALWRALGDNVGIARTLNGLGITFRDQGSLDQAEELHLEALDLLDGTNESRLRGSILNNLGAVAYFRGDIDRTFRFWSDAAEITRTIGDNAGLSSLLGNLGALALMRGEPEQAIALHDESYALAKDLGSRDGSLRALVNLGGAYLELKEYERATEYFENALRESRDLGDVEAEAIILFDLGRVAESVSGASVGATRYLESLSLFWKTGNLPAVAACLERIGCLAIGQGRHGQATRIFAAAEQIRQTTGAARMTVDHGEYEEFLAKVRACLSEAEFAAAWAAGQALPIEDAVAEAIAEANHLITAMGAQ